MKTRKKRPKFHPELSLSPELERGTGETFIKHLILNSVDLSAAKENVKKALDRINFIC